MASFVKTFPTVQQIKRALPFGPVIQHETTNANGEAYGLPVITGGELAPVTRTLVLCDEKMRYYVCAVLKEHSWEPKYNSAGCKQQTIAGWDVTLTRQSSDLGLKLIDLKLGQKIALFSLDLLTVNIGGGPVPGCESFAELACLVEYQLFKQHLDKRKSRLQADVYSFKKFTELRSYTEVLNREIEAQQHFEAIQLSSLRCLDDVLNLEKKLIVATEREMSNLQSFRNEVVRLEGEAKELSRFPSRAHYEAYKRRKQQEQEKERQLQEDNERKEQARLLAEQEKDSQRREQIERRRIEQLRQAQLQEERRLKLQHQQRQKYPQELLQAQYATLPTSEELSKRIQSLAAFYPPSRDNYDAFVQQLKLLSIGCKRCMKSTSKNGDAKEWADALSEMKKLKIGCLRLAEDNHWPRPEEDEAWKVL